MTIDDFLRDLIDDYDSFTEEYKQECRNKVQEFVAREIAAASEAKDNAYWERDQLVAALSKIWPSHLTRHPMEDEDWEDDWRNIVCVHSPVGQLTWHIHDSEVQYFYHLDTFKNDWDGHTTEEKYDRLAALGREAETGKGN